MEEDSCNTYICTYIIFGVNEEPLSSSKKKANNPTKTEQKPYRHSQKSMYRWPNKLRKGAQYHYSSGKCKLKPQRDTATQPPEILK